MAALFDKSALPPLAPRFIAGNVDEPQAPNVQDCLSLDMCLDRVRARRVACRHGAYRCNNRTEKGNAPL